MPMFPAAKAAEWPVSSPITAIFLPALRKAAILQGLSSGNNRFDPVPRLAEDYDALHLTHDGYLRTRSPRRSPRLVGWDCESTLWFRWMFTEWHDVQPCFVNADRFDDLWLALSGWSAADYRCHRMPEDKASKEVYERMLREMAGGRQSRDTEWNVSQSET